MNVKGAVEKDTPHPDIFLQRKAEIGKDRKWLKFTFDYLGFPN